MVFVIVRAALSLDAKADEAASASPGLAAAGVFYQAGLQASGYEKSVLLAEARRRLDEIVESDPSSEVAVKVMLQEEVNGIDIRDLDRALSQSPVPVEASEPLEHELRLASSLYAQADHVPPGYRQDVLETVRSLLDQIAADHPGSDVAVRLMLGENVAGIDLAALDQRLAEHEGIAAPTSGKQMSERVEVDKPSAMEQSRMPNSTATLQQPLQGPGPDETQSRRAAELTQREADSLRLGIIKYFVYASEYSGRDIEAIIAVQLDEQGELLAEPTLVRASGTSEESRVSLFEAGRRAILKAENAGEFAKLPPEKHGAWRRINVTFTPDNVEIPTGLGRAPETARASTNPSEMDAASITRSSPTALRPQLPLGAVDALAVTGQSASPDRPKDGRSAAKDSTSAALEDAEGQNSVRSGGDRPPPSAADASAGTNSEARETALGLETQHRLEVQRRLSLLGLDTKGIDGIFGPGTRQAIEQWQRSAGLAPSGYLDRDQLDRLKQDTSTAYAAWQETARQQQNSPEANERPSTNDVAKFLGTWRLVQVMDDRGRWVTPTSSRETMKIFDNRTYSITLPSRSERVSGTWHFDTATGTLLQTQGRAKNTLKLSGSTIILTSKKGKKYRYARVQ